MEGRDPIRISPNPQAPPHNFSRYIVPTLSGGTLPICRRPKTFATSETLSPPLPPAPPSPPSPLPPPQRRSEHRETPYRPSVLPLSGGVLSPLDSPHPPPNAHHHRHPHAYSNLGFLLGKPLPILIAFLLPFPTIFRISCGMEKLRIFRNTSVAWRPSAVVALATSSDGRQVAAAREDCSVEIWLVSTGSVGWHCQLRIHGESSMRVTSLVWLRPGAKGGPGRLISSGIDGSVSEWDVYSLKQKVIMDSVGVSIWQLAVEPSTEFGAMKPYPNHSANGYVKDYPHSDSESCQSDDDDKDEAHFSNAKDSQCVAIACDDGCIRMYTSSASGEFSYKRSFPRVSGRILSVVWSIDAKFLFSGTSDGLIRCWDTASVHECYRITVGNGGLGGGSELCVWSLLFLRCGTLVSADSAGNVQFWDSRHGTLLQAHSYHRGDATALAASPGHSRVFSAGSDGQVILYKLSKDTNAYDEHGCEGATIWTYVDNRRVHSHDVRALTVAVPISYEDLARVEKIKRRRGREKPISFSYDKWAHLGVPMLLSAGDDTKIFAYSVREFTKFSPHDICPAPQHLPVNLALGASTGTSTDKSPLLLIQYPSCLDILSVHADANTPSHICTGWNAATKLLAQIKSKQSRKIICSAISDSGRLIGYSDHFKPNLIELRREKKGKFSITKRRVPKEIPFAHCMVFSVDSSNMMLAGNDRKIYIVDVDNSELLHTFVPARKEVSKNSQPSEPPITKMFTSPDGQWLTAINCFGDIYIFDLQTYRQHWFISRLDDASVTAGGFPPGNSNILVITTSSNQVYAFDVEAKELGEWSRHHASMLPRRFQEFPGDVVGLTFSPSSPTSVIVYSARAMCMIDFGMSIEQDDTDLSNISSLSLEKLLAARSNTTKRKRKDSGQEIMPRTRNFDFCGFKDPTLFISHLSEKSLFVLQKPWSEIVQMFDAPVHRHIYGT